MSQLVISLICSRNTPCPWPSACAYPSASSVRKRHPPGMFLYWKRQRAASWRMPDPNDILKVFEILRWKALYKNKVLLPRQRKMHTFSVSIQEPNMGAPSAPLWYFVCISLDGNIDKSSILVLLDPGYISVCRKWQNEREEPLKESENKCNSQKPNNSHSIFKVY